MNKADTMIRVVSKRRERFAAMARGDETVIDVDRTNPVLGNRFVLRNHEDDVERAQVIASYKREFDADCAAGGPKSRAVDDIVARMRRGQKVALRCWCARTDKVRPCHADMIRDAAIARFEAIEATTPAAPAAPAKALSQTW